MNNGKPTYKELIDRVSELEKKLAKTQWLHEKESSSQTEQYIPYYGDVTKLNTERTILDAVGKKMLSTLTSELMDLLDTSVAIYEKNGDYAFGVFNSGWCQVLESSSRKLCNTDDNKIALSCGKWHCHDDCWNNSAKAAIIAKKSTDIDCIGAIKLYAEPIFVDDEVVGVINIGYGNPPTDDKTLYELAEKFGIAFDTLKQKALEYKPRPAFIIGIAKKRLKSIAKLIGEIISRKQAEIKLLERTNLLKRTEELAHIGSWEWEVANDTVRWSDELFRIFGLNPENGAVLWKNHHKIYTPESFKKLEKAVKEALETGKSYNLNLDAIRSNGEIRNCSATGFAETDKQAKVVKLYGVLQDITEFKMTEQALKESKEKYKALYKSMNEGLCLHQIVFDEKENTPVDYKIIDVNPKYEKLIGIKKEQVVNKLASVVYPGGEPPFLKKYSEVAITGKPTRFETYFAAYDQYFQISVFSPAKNQFATVFQDITQRKKAEEALRVNNERYKKAQEIGSVGNWEYNLQTREFWGSEQGKQIYGLDPETDEFSAEEVYKHVIDREKVEQAMIDLLDKNKKYDIEFEIAPKNGTENKYIRSIARLERDKNGNPYKVVGVLHDITEKRKSEQALKESEEKLSTIFNNSQSFICIADINTATFKYINPTFKRILGYEEKELLNKPFTDFIHPNDVEPTIQVVEKDLKAGKAVVSFENRYRCKDGSYCWLSWNSYPKPEQGVTYAIAHDVTDRKEFQRKLQEKNEEYEAMNEELKQTNEELFVAKERTEESEWELNLTLDATTDGIWKWNFVENELFFSPNYYRMLGYEPNEFDANFENWVSLIHPDDREKAIRTAEKWLAKKDTDYENTFRLKTKNNDYLWLISTGKVVERDKNGNAIRMIGNHINITPVKKAEKEVLKHKKEFETWIQNTPVCTKKIDLDFNLQFMSQAGIKELKVDDVNKLYGAPYPFNFFPEDFQKAMLAKIKEVKKTEKIMQIDGILSDTEGNRMWYNHILVPVHNNAGQLDYILIISTDISERKRAEQKLKEKNAEYEALNEELRQTNEELFIAKEKAEESDRLKTAFLNNLSHEIRTPLNAICGFSQRLSKPALSVEKRNSFVSIIQNSSDQLLSIVSDILTISTLETKQEQLYIDKVYINEVIVNTLANFRQQGINQNISIYAKQPLSDSQSCVYTDHTKLTQILAVLISNSLKFTHEGFVEFGYRLKAEMKPAEIEFYVKDTGIGISKVLHKKIFDHFRQAETDLAKKYGGTGLGLSIAKGFVELLGGRIWVDSEPGKGSIFYFTVPYKPVNKVEHKNETVVQKQHQKTVLVAEDEEFNFLYIEELLIDMDLKLIHAKNGKEAVDICNHNPEIDLILMDIKMPIMNGYEAAKIIKKQRPDLPVVAQSAYALNHEIEQYKDIFDDYMAKPIKEKLLVEITKKHLRI